MSITYKDMIYLDHKKKGTAQPEKVENMKTLWSVELEANGYEDDTFNGTFEKCIEYCKDYDYAIGTECRLAEFLIDEYGRFIECLEIVDEI